jgi:hypothetical protein
LAGRGQARVRPFSSREERSSDPALRPGLHLRRLLGSGCPALRRGWRSRGRRRSVWRISPAVTPPRECASDLTTSQAPQKVVVLLIDDESVNSGSVASFQKVIDLTQNVVDSFFDFDDRFEADDRPPVGTRDLIQRVDRRHPKRRPTSPKETIDLTRGHHDASQRVLDPSDRVLHPTEGAADPFQKVRRMKRFIQWTP